MKIKMKYQGRDGLFLEHEGAKFEPHTFAHVRVTVPAREELERVGCILTQTHIDPPLFDVRMSDIAPIGMIATRILNTDHLGLRLEIEPKFPGEIGHAYYEQMAFTPCPICGATLVWYEAGYVPGYRVCVKAPHHHSMPEDTAKGS